MAAVDLFTEQGFDDTTVAQITERAGLTKSTFFRHFSDKREVLAAGQEWLSLLLAEGIAAAPADTSVFDTLALALDRVSGEMTSFNYELGPRLAAAVAANTELQAREAMKTVGMAAAISEAFLARGLDAPTAQLAGELGVLAFRIGFGRWLADKPGALLSTHTRAALAELRTASAALS